MTTRFRAATLLSVFLMTGCLAAGAAAQDAPPEHLVIKPMQGAAPTGQSTMDEHGQLAVRFREAGQTVARTVEDRYWHLYYEFAAATPPSNAEVLANYVAETERVGGEVLNRTATRLLFRLPHAGGGTTWGRVAAVSAGRYELEIVDEAALVPSLEFDADALREALDRDGHVAVYGILFDVDRTSLRPGSGKVLDEVARLLQADPSLALEVQGHTDATGAAARNRELSLQRAGAVVEALALYGVAHTRLTPEGLRPRSAGGGQRHRGGTAAQPARRAGEAVVVQVRAPRPGHSGVCSAPELTRPCPCRTSPVGRG